MITTVYTCARCGKSFEGRWRRDRIIKFCSPECQAKQKKICPTCGKEFLPHREKQVVCSQTCVRRKKTGVEINFVCKVCGKKVCHYAHPSEIKKKTFEFCSPSCRNKARTKTREAQICEVCGKEFIHNDLKLKKTCSPKCNRAYLSSFSTYEDMERVQNYITENYATLGAVHCAKELGITKRILYSIAYRLGLVMDDDVRKQSVSELNRQKMILNNPMKNPEIAKKVHAHPNQSPERKAINLARGRQMQDKRRVTKLERLLFSILDKLGVEYESHVIIKDKFIVDCKIGEHLIIEADGDYWHGHPRFEPLTDRQISQQKRDASRNKYLATCGYWVERIWESDMSKEVVKAILQKHGLLP